MRDAGRLGHNADTDGGACRYAATPLAATHGSGDPVDGRAADQCATDGVTLCPTDDACAGHERNSHHGLAAGDGHADFGERGTVGPATHGPSVFAPGRDELNEHSSIRKYDEHPSGGDAVITCECDTPRPLRDRFSVLEFAAEARLRRDGRRLESLPAAPDAAAVCDAPTTATTNICHLDAFAAESQCHPSKCDAVSVH
ncbi:hypothetical protein CAUPRSCDRAFT_11202 [Caulochytrium protostelioides]|uniref:Uncharacterized protein n=1 Tax=Caulochytrium protostelioides TaxID=1555241 RepID=A0A4P9WUR1_9FUNG|nr:hypothetical protein CAUPRSCDRAFT_11202 [Caulochytrium protostelioides]